MNKSTRLVKVLRGNGLISTNGEDYFPIPYEIDVFQNFQQSYQTEIPTTKDLRFIFPVDFTGANITSLMDFMNGNEVTLQINKLQKIKIQAINSTIDSIIAILTCANSSDSIDFLNSIN
jgi:hypothetical protein